MSSNILSKDPLRLATRRLIWRALCLEQCLYLGPCTCSSIDESKTVDRWGYMCKGSREAFEYQNGMCRWLYTYIICRRMIAIDRVSLGIARSSAHIVGARSTASAAASRQQICRAHVLLVANVEREGRACHHDGHQALQVLFLSGHPGVICLLTSKVFSSAGKRLICVDSVDTLLEI